MWQLLQSERPGKVQVGEARPALEAAYPALPLAWLDDALERGGEGVVLLTAEALARLE